MTGSARRTHDGPSSESWADSLLKSRFLWTAPSQLLAGALRRLCVSVLGVCSPTQLPFRLKPVIHVVPVLRPACLEKLVGTSANDVVVRSR
jgi:hypothetical protein